MINPVLALSNLEHCDLEYRYGELRYKNTYIKVLRKYFDTVYNVDKKHGH